MKKCSKCNKDKEDIRFAFKKNRSGSYLVKSICKDCTNVRQKERRKKEDLTTRDSRLLKQKEWNVSNKDKIITLKAKYRFKARMIRLSSIPHDAHITDYVKYMHKVNTAIYDAHVKAWRLNGAAQARWMQEHDMSYVVFNRLKRGVQRCFAKKGNIDSRGWFGVLDYTAHELKKHIEDQFVGGMGWDNRGEWHIDHIKPLCMYDIKSIHDKGFKECFALDNLRPLWANHNMIKYHTYDKHLAKNHESYQRDAARG